MNEIKNIIVIDYLLIRLELTNKNLINKLISNRNKELKINDLDIVFNTGVQNKDYINYDSLYIENQYIGTIHSINKHNRNENNKISLIIANELFYSGLWFEYYKKIVQYLDLKLLNIIRLDIAKDMSNSHLLNTIYNINRNPKIKSSIKTTLKNHVQKFDDVNTNTLDLVSYGSYSSPIYIKIYNKSNQLKKENKPYINDFWILNNLLPTNKIERFEITLQKDSTKNIEIDKLTNPEYLDSIVQKETEKRFRIIKECKRGKRITFKDVTPIPFHSGNVNYIKYSQSKRNDSILPLKTVKSMIKGLYIYSHTTQSEPTKEALKEMLNSYNLNDYLNNNKNKWMKI